MKSMGNVINEEEVQKLASLLGFGYYRVTKQGYFLDCDDKAREIFEIPQNEPDLTKYSITDFYVVPAERDRRLEKLFDNQCSPLTGTISARIKGKYMLLFDMCWCCPEEYQGQPCFIGLVTKIQSSMISPKMYENFPRGLYELDDDDRIARANRTLVNILKYPDEKMLLGKMFCELCVDEKRLNTFNEKIKSQGYAREILIMRDYFKQIIEVECFSQDFKEFGRSRWGMISNVSKREQYYRALDSVPTGFYYIEKERIKQCNDHFARLMGFRNKEDAIGKDTRNYFVNKKDVQKYFEDLRKADKAGKPLQNYPVKIRRANDRIIVTLAVDAHLVKNFKGQLIGRRGTIRDISGEIKLRKKAAEAEKRLKKTTADINSLIHNFLHPVLKFSGNSELMHQVGKTLHKTSQKGSISTIDGYKDSEKLGEKVLKRLIELRDVIPNSDEVIPFPEQEENSGKIRSFKHLTMKELKRKLSLMVNIFDYSLSTSGSNILLDGAIRDTALWLLEELTQIDYASHEILKYYLNKEFVDFLQDILFNYLIVGTKIMVDETKIMKMEIETIRRYLGFQFEKKYVFINTDVGKIVEDVLELFMPVFAEVGLEIQFKKSGSLTAKVSPEDIKRVLNNLFQNARKYSYTREGRFVKIRVRELGNTHQVEFSIENLGTPIKEHEIRSNKIFLPGYRGESAYASDRDGTGVGLTDARDVIAAHGGTISVTSTPTKGETDPRQYNVPYLTKVTIILPKFGPKFKPANNTERNHGF
jgi:PAS domain S-box-containing protein